MAQNWSQSAGFWPNDKWPAGVVPFKTKNLRKLICEDGPRRWYLKRNLIYYWHFFTGLQNDKNYPSPFPPWYWTLAVTPCVIRNCLQQDFFVLWKQLKVKCLVKSLKLTLWLCTFGWPSDLWSHYWNSPTRHKIIKWLFVVNY